MVREETAVMEKVMTLIDANIIAALALGFTHYVDVGKGEDAAIYYENEHRVHMRLPGVEAVMHGEWRILSDGYYVRWLDGPEGKWQIESVPGALTYIGPDGHRAGPITRIVPGDAAQLRQ
jgi:hypothetical protein